MSITGAKSPKLKKTSGSRNSPDRRPALRRPLVLSLAVGVIAALAIGGTLWGFHHGRSAPTSTSAPTQTVQQAPISPTAPITLPKTLDGLPAVPVATDFDQLPTWRARAKAAARKATVSGRSYGTAPARRHIRVVAGRADLTGKLEFAWTTDSGRTVQSPQGVAHCTQKLKLTPGSQAVVRPTMLFCWRTTPTLSAYSDIVDFDHHPVDADGVAVLDTIWEAAQTGR